MSNQNVNPDLSSERSKASFDTGKLSSFLYGGDEAIARRKEILKWVESSPEFDEPRPPVFMGREERVENAMKRVLLMTKRAEEIDSGNLEDVQYFQNLVMGREYHALSLHYVMFLPTLQSQASPEQQEKWLPLAMIRGINGTYAQTELGHGTNLRKLETTATYDPTTQEFILNTPTITATKWWPGNLGKTTNYALVVAQLWTQGKCHGVHGFLVQLRDLDTHMPLHGIEVGDIGPKFGMTSNDNGYLRLNNVRVPREHMMMRSSKVLPNGDYVPAPHSKLTYGAMVFVRSVMIRDQAIYLATAATIATRYSCVRRQGEITPGYTLHALSSGLKSVVTWGVAQGIEQCRLACGGHGYMHASGLPDLYGNAVGGCTYEGDNIVMLLQVARFLVKAGRAAAAGEEQSVLTKYLTKTYASKSPLNQSLQFEHLLDAFEHVAQRKVRWCVGALEGYKHAGFTPEDAWNKCGVELCKAARAHVRLFLVSNFMDTVITVPDKATREVLTKLCRFFVLHQFYNKAGQFIEDGYVSAQQVAFVREALYSTMALLRPNAVALADSWDFADRELRSVLGRYDGQVYPNMLEWVKHSNLNKTEVLESVKKYIFPAMKEARSKL